MIFIVEWARTAEVGRVCVEEGCVRVEEGCVRVKKGRVLVDGGGGGRTCLRGARTRKGSGAYAYDVGPTRRGGARRRR